MNGQKELLDRAELLKALDIEANNLAKWMRHGDFPYLTHGGEVYFLKDEVVRWMDSLKYRHSDDTYDAIPTQELIVRLLEAPDLDDFLQIYQRRLVHTVFHEYITGLAKKMRLKKTEIFQAANLSEGYGYQLFRGERLPSRETVIALAFGFKADAELSGRLLRAANMRELYPKIPREAVILYCLEHKKSLADTQLKLNSLSMPLIGGNSDE